MLSACTSGEFATDPVGRYVSGERYVHFCASPKLWGIVVWGRPGEADVSAIWSTLKLEFTDPAVPHAAVIDASRMEVSDAGTFARIESFVRRYEDSLRAYILRLALVRPGGLGGAIVTGAPAVLSLPAPVTVFDGLDAALAWVAPEGGIEGEVSDVVRAIDAAQEASSGTPKHLRDLRVHLEASLDRASLESAARALATSERSLQRRLGEAGTTFQEEVARARVRVAERMLEDPERPLTEIAIAVGCASLQHFSTVFKKVTGSSPSAWRRRLPR